MALDSYSQIWNRVLLRCPALSSKLAQDWVQNAFRQIAERRRWSWLIRYGQFLAPALYNTGTVTLTRNSTTVTGSGTVWDASMVGRQFRVSTATPIYTIAQFNSATSIELDAVWGGASASGSVYEIYQCFFTPPSDFHALITVWDPAMNWQLWRHVQQQELNTWDAQRSSRGQAYVVASRDYTTAQVGIVGSPTQITGSGPAPTSGGTYTAPADTIFTVVITTGGASGTAVFKWSKDSAGYTTGVVTDAAGTAQNLQDGVQVAFPTGATYVLNDTFVIQARAVPNAGLPRFEIWPHQTAQYVYPFLYEARATDLSDTGAVLPRYIRGDALLELALAEAARYPGPSADRPNPYFNIKLSDMHQMRAERMLLDLERQDDETFEQDVTFQMPLGFPYATPLGDASWLQAHAI